MVFYHKNLFRPDLTQLVVFASVICPPEPLSISTFGGWLTICLERSNVTQLELLMSSSINLCYSSHVSGIDYKPNVPLLWHIQRLKHARLSCPHLLYFGNFHPILAATVIIAIR